MLRALLEFGESPSSERGCSPAEVLEEGEKCGEAASEGGDWLSLPEVALPVRRGAIARDGLEGVDGED